MGNLSISPLWQAAIYWQQLCGIIMLPWRISIFHLSRPNSWKLQMYRALCCQEGPTSNKETNRYLNSTPISYGVSRDRFVYVPGQWETMLHCNIVSHWLGAYKKWSQCIISMLFGIDHMQWLWSIASCHNVKVKSVRWLLMAWHLFSTSPSATIMTK